MPCPHNEITIVQRSQRQSAVAAAAYQSGEKLFCEYDQQVKHYPEKRGIVHNEILLPANAPQEYADRNTLWNAAEAVEKQWNSQLARRWVLTIPREIPPDQYAVLVREFCEQQFVSKGMIADFAIHDPHPPGHNPHAHVLLTMRAMDEHGKWLPNLLMKYMEIRKEERKDWTRAGQNRGTSQDLKAVSEALSYLRQKGLSTVEDLEAFLESSGKSAADYRNQMKPKEARSKVIDGILASRTDCKECKAVYEKYQKIFFKKIKGKFKQEHPEVARYEKAADYLAKHPDDKDKTKNELQQEQETLLSEIAELKVPLTEVQEDLKKLRDIRYWVRKATPGTEESKEPPKKQPIKEVLQDKTDEKKAQRTAPAQEKHRQQDMEL